MSQQEAPISVIFISDVEDGNVAKASQILQESGYRFLNDTEYTKVDLLNINYGNLSSNRTYLLMVDSSGQIVTVPIYYDGDNTIHFEKSIVIPPSNLSIGETAYISNGNRALNVTDPTSTGKRGFMVVQKYTTGGGTERTHCWCGTGAGYITRQGLSDELSDGATFTYTVPQEDTEQSVWNGAYKLKTNKIETEITASISIRRESSEGELIYSNTATITTDADGYAEFNLDNVIIFDVGEELYIELALDSVYGHTIGDEFKPYLEVYRMLLSENDFIISTDNPILEAEKDSDNDLNLTHYDESVTTIESERGVLRLDEETTVVCTNADQYYQVTGTFSGNDQSKNFTISDIDDDITYSGSGGYFLLNGVSGVKSSKVATITYALFKNGSLVSQATTPFEYTQANTTKDIAITDILTINENDYFDVRAKSSVASNTLTIKDLRLTFWR